MNRPEGSDAFSRSRRSTTNAMSATHAREYLVQPGRLLRTDVQLRIVLRRPGDHAPVGEHGQARAVRRIDADDDVAVTGQVFRDRRVVDDAGRRAASQDEHRVRGLLRRHGGVLRGVAMDLRQVSRQPSHDGEATGKIARRPDLGWNVVARGLGSGRGRRIPNPDEDLALCARHRRQRVDCRVVDPVRDHAPDGKFTGGRWQRELGPALDRDRRDQHDDADHDQQGERLEYATR